MKCTVLVEPLTQRGAATMVFPARHWSYVLYECSHRVSMAICGHGCVPNVLWLFVPNCPTALLHWLVSVFSVGTLMRLRVM